jgi:1,4-dihydroxy-2-naphthoate octaprenyltransferase
LICSILIQIITNYINEIFDFKKGADNEERLGPKRMVASGEISLKSMKKASTILIIITFFLGLILVYESGWVILAIGLFSLFFAYAYTGGPYPLAYKGVGDIFVLIFFGIAAVAGTYYILTGAINEIVILTSLGPGFLSMNLLGVNNIRDIDTDKKVGKMTLAVRLGRKKANYLYIFLMAGTYFLPFAIGHLTQSLYNLIPVISIFLGIKLSVDVVKKQGRDLIKVLEGTGKLLLLYGLLTSIGFILTKYLM